MVVVAAMLALGCGETSTGGGGTGGDAGTGGTGGESRFNPSGCEVHVRGRWLVDGQDPSAETCGNIALVRLNLVDDPEEQFWVPAEFSLRCDAENDENAAIIDGGAYIDTRIVTRSRCGGSGEILREPPTNEYKSRWTALTDTQFIVDCSPIIAISIMPTEGDLLLDVGTVNLRTGPAGTTCPTP